MFKKLFSKLLGKSNGEVQNPKSRKCATTVKCDNTDADSLSKLVEYIASRLVDSPNDLDIKVEKNDKVVKYLIICKKDDVGKIVGRNGRTIRAIRNLVSSAGGRAGYKAMVEIVD